MERDIAERRRYENTINNCGFGVFVLALSQVYLPYCRGEGFVEKMNDYLKYKNIYINRPFYSLVLGIVLGIIISKLF